MKADLKERFSLIKDITGIDLGKLVTSIAECDALVFVVWDSFDSMKHAEIVDYCLKDVTNTEVHHSFYGA